MPRTTLDFEYKGKDYSLGYDIETVKDWIVQACLQRSQEVSVL